jgi:PAS domain S-box-containing protein
MGTQENTIALLLKELENANRRIAELESDARKSLPDGTSLQDCYEYFRIHFSLANDVMYSYDETEGLKYISPNVERILGYKPEELLGRKFSGLLELLDPEDRGDAMEDAAQVLTGKTVMYAIYRFIAKDGTRKFGEVSGVPLIHNGKVTAVVSVAREIKEHAVTEGKPEGTASGTGKSATRQEMNPWLLLGRGGVVLDLNDAAAELLRKSRGEVVGSSIFTHAPEKISFQRRINFDRIMASGKTDSFVEEVEGKLYFNVMAPHRDERGCVSEIELNIQELSGKK